MSAGSPISCTATASRHSEEDRCNNEGSLRTKPQPTLNVPSRREIEGGEREGEEEDRQGGVEEWIEFGFFIFIIYYKYFTGEIYECCLLPSSYALWAKDDDSERLLPLFVLTPGAVAAAADVVAAFLADGDDMDCVLEGDA